MARLRAAGGIVKKNTHPGTLILFGQISFIFLLAISVALHPGFVFKSDEGGISNYGIHLKTALPYTLAFTFCAFFSLRAANLCRQSNGSSRHLWYMLYIYSVLMLLTLLSTFTYKLSYGFKQAHIVAGVATIIFEFLASAWMFFRLRHPLDSMFLFVELVGFVLSGLTFLGTLHVLFLGQSLAVLGFALLLIRTGRALESLNSEPGSLTS